jgi:hypothetical protein
MASAHDPCTTHSGPRTVSSQTASRSAQSWSTRSVQVMFSDSAGKAHSVICVPSQCGGSGLVEHAQAINSKAKQAKSDFPTMPRS